MTYQQLNQKFLAWALLIGAESQTLEGSTPIVLLTRELEESERHLVGEIFFAVSLYTDRLHTFLYSERTTWLKDERGDTNEPLSEVYEVVSFT